jgi:hypothetical protein
LATFFSFLGGTGPCALSSSVILRRSKRTPVPTTRWEEKAAPSAAVDPKITKKTVKTKQKTSFKSITIGIRPKPIELDKNDFPEQSKHISVPETGWKQTGAPSIALDPQIIEKTARTTQKTALKPVIAGSLPKALELDRNDLPELLSDGGWRHRSSSAPQNVVISVVTRERRLLWSVRVEGRRPYFPRFHSSRIRRIEQLSILQFDRLLLFAFN